MKVVIVVCFTLLLLLPVGSATELIKVTTNGDHPSRAFANKNGETYTFSLPPSAYNYSAPFAQNDSIWSMNVEGGYTRQHPFSISDTTHFAVTYNWNTTENLELAFDYIKHGWGYLAYWQTVYTVTYNGAFVCHVDTVGNTDQGFVNSAVLTAKLLGNSISPIPAGQLGGAGYPGLMSENKYRSLTENNTPGFVIRYVVSDDLHPQATCVNPATGDSTLNFTLLTAPVSMTIGVNNANTYDNLIDWEFENRTQRINLTLTSYKAFGALGDVLADVFCAHGFFAFVTCFVTETIGAFFVYIFSFINQVLTLFFGLIPGGLVLYNIIKFPIQFLIDISLLGFKILFSSGPNYSTGGVVWSLFIYSIDIGLGLVALTGNWDHVWKAPFAFIWGSTVGVFYAAKFIYWTVPTTIVTVISGILTAVKLR